ncbi:GTP cyclohydrolase 1 type 2/Nif3 [Xylariaceae sp. FL0255]|nr:GTP cyclohydrolase 1 type 2/Nif3 [Xylariaceae sp. FL0255]
MSTATQQPASSASASLQKYKLVFFVPTVNAEEVKKAIFAAGAGRYPGPGEYTECAWQTSGSGEFRPGEGANPHLGSVGNLFRVDELRVETLCVGLETARKVAGALIKAHPYEEAAYEFYKIEDIEPIMPE